jgi:hypothetical protein
MNVVIASFSSWREKGQPLSDLHRADVYVLGECLSQEGLER